MNYDLIILSTGIFPLFFVGVSWLYMVYRRDQIFKYFRQNEWDPIRAFEMFRQFWVWPVSKVKKPS